MICYVIANGLRSNAPNGLPGCHHRAQVVEVHQRFKLAAGNGHPTGLLSRGRRRRVGGEQLVGVFRHVGGNGRVKFLRHGAEGARWGKDGENRVDLGQITTRQVGRHSVHVEGGNGTRGIQLVKQTIVVFGEKRKFGQVGGLGYVQGIFAIVELND